MSRLFTTPANLDVLSMHKSTKKAEEPFRVLITRDDTELLSGYPLADGRYLKTLAMETTSDSLNARFREEDGSVLFESYIPPSRDAINLPSYILYLIMAVFILFFVLYAIIGHLIKDLIHDFADLLFGEQPEEVVVNYCEAKDKFMIDWCPETSPELEALARAEENKFMDRDFRKAPAIWILSTEPLGNLKSGPRVVFGNRA
ncbi:uncharacterized protein LOC118117162 isoform X2 [Hippoglossus stenolepis]|uniref:uncharacterized protein LOC118117162 isoform X2 n=1 Tax=Hippoglossus stenolepis TaxID=195615 RepID=UPI00159C8B3E|nr:uncharacterized protein LOC118117162 isoform X2 [Hippoglossus stenolepis]